jgi:hypothetical protein
MVVDAMTRPAKLPAEPARGAVATGAELDSPPATSSDAVVSQLSPTVSFTRTRAPRDEPILRRSRRGKESRDARTDYVRGRGLRQDHR